MDPLLPYISMSRLKWFNICAKVSGGREGAAREKINIWPKIEQKLRLTHFARRDSETYLLIQLGCEIPGDRIRKGTGKRAGITYQSSTIDHIFLLFCNKHLHKVDQLCEYVEL